MDFSYGGLINAWFTLYILASPFWWPKQIRLVRNQTKLRYVIRMVCFDYSTFLYLDDPRVFDSLRRIEKKKVLLKINVSLVHMVISIEYCFLLYLYRYFFHRITMSRFHTYIAYDVQYSATKYCFLFDNEYH